jgi:hypothetical protein
MGRFLYGVQRMIPTGIIPLPKEEHAFSPNPAKKNLSSCGRP